MNAKTTRILKEARPLFWPWCAVTLAGLLPLLLRQSDPWLHGIGIEGISVLGVVVGIPLLATLSFGNEFQHRTLSLLLTQPVDRMEIWGEKLSVTVVAVLSAALVYYIGWRTELQQVQGLALFFGAWILATIASATFWTLLARSTLGGIVLNYGFPWLLNVAWAILPDRIRGSGEHLWTANLAFLSSAALVLLCYAGVTLWLGRRKLARFQVTGGMAGDDLLTAGAGIVPGPFAGWFRCRPSGALLNLVRKELRLQRPLWLLTLLAVLGWTCVTLLGPVPETERGSASPLQVAVVLLGTLSLLIAVLAGSLSLGEERTSGTHSWHMTLPVSARRQWLIKLFLALLTGAVCGVLLPALVVTAGRFLLGSPFRFVEPRAVMAWLLAVSLLSLASFWCACAVNGTVRAALWAFPAMAALLYAAAFGRWLAPALMDLLVSIFNPFADFRFTNALSSVQWASGAEGPTLLAILVFGPALLLAVRQTSRLFPAQPSDRSSSVIRPLAPLALVTLLCSLALGALDSAGDHARSQVWGMLRETHAAIEKLQPGTAKLEANQPLQLTAEDLAKASPLSERTRRWLDKSSITVTAYQPHPGPSCCGSLEPPAAPDRPYTYYSATIHLAGGAVCNVSFQGVLGRGILRGGCE